MPFIPKIGEYYIIRNKEQNKEQYAHLEYVSGKSYYFDYGVFGFHETNCKKKYIRELTDTEKTYRKNNEFWKLPQQFYQSFPT